MPPDKIEPHRDPVPETHLGELLGCAIKLLNLPLCVADRLDAIVQEILEHLAVDSCSIFLLDRRSDRLVLRATRGLEPGSVGRMALAVGEGITGYAALRRASIAIRDMHEDPRNRFSPWTGDDRHRSILAVPILDGDDLLGVINVQTDLERLFGGEEIRLLERFAEQVIVGSIRHAQLVEQMERRQIELLMLSEIGHALNSALDLDTLLMTIAEKAAEALHAKGVAIRLLVEENDLVIGAVNGLPSGASGGLSLDGEKRIAELVASTGEPILIDDLRGRTDSVQGGSSLACVPLVHEEKVIGTLSVLDKIVSHDTERRLFDTDDLNVLFTLASQAAEAVEDIHLHRELYSLIRNNKKRLDEMTLLYNRTSAIIESITDGLLAIDQDGKVSEMNPVAGSLLLGDSEPPADGLMIDEVVLDKPTIRERLSSKDVSEGFTNRVVTVHGKRGRLSVMATLRPIVGSKGEAHGALMTFRPMAEVGRLVGGVLGSWLIYTFDDIIGKSDNILAVKELAQIASQTTSNVLIQGETGTGKELFAQAIHNASSRAEGPFVAVNCAAIPRDLIESELFGYVEGAFTGARRGGSFGKFELASGGTIFLDEIGEMPVDVQAKLLRVLQDKSVVRIGGDRTIPIDVRIMAATNRDLVAAMGEGTFREELYYRLSVMIVEIPPLRERARDIPAFIDAFVRRFAGREGKQIDGVEEEVVQGLISYSWPGNVRELENALEHAVAVCNSGSIAWVHLPARLRQAVETIGKEGQPVEPLVTERKQQEDSSRKLYIEAVRRTRGDIDEAARLLGISRATLYRKLRKYGLGGDVAAMRQTSQT